MTPRTDAATFQGHSRDDQPVVHQEFARELERENARLAAELKARMDDLGRYMMALNSPMNEAKAKEILGGMITSDGGLFHGGHYIAWAPGEAKVTLDDAFTAEELEAIVWWMRNHNGWLP